MSKCELRIVLDRPDRTYAVGERIKGAVQVTAHADCECRKLTLTWQWRTHGKGNVDSGGPEERTLFAGRWLAGETNSYPYDFVAPPGPLTYHGNLVNVDWYLRAEADLPMALDQKAEEEFLLVAGSAPGEIDLGPDYEPPKAPTPRRPDQTEPKRFGIPLTAIGIIVLVVGLGLVGQRLRSILGESGALAHGEWLTTGGFFGLVMVVVGGIVTLMGIRKAMLRSKLGFVEAEISSNTVRLGEAVRVALRVRPRSQTDLAEVTAKLTATETATSGSGTNRSTSSHVMYQDHLTLASERQLMPGESVALEGTLHVPLEAPCTFMASDNKLVWEISLRLHLRGWPDWSKEFPVTVRPEVGGNVTGRS